MIVQALKRDRVAFGFPERGKREVSGTLVFADAIAAFISENGLG